MLNKIRLVKQHLNGKFVLGITGPKQLITEFANRLYNYEATDSGLNFMSENFIYIHTTEKRLKRGLVSIFEAAADWGKQDGVKKTLQAKNRAKNLMDSIIREDFLDTGLKSDMIYQESPTL